MEDLTTTSAAYTKDELALMGRHPVAQAMKELVHINTAIYKAAQNSNKSQKDISFTVKDKFNRMTHIWSKLGPSRQLARRMYVDQAPLFDLLDKSLAIKRALRDMSHNRPIHADEKCRELCCTSVL